MMKMQVLGMVCPCYLGVYDEEQLATRDVLIDAEFLMPASPRAWEDDRIEGVFNYERVVHQAQATAARKRYALVEALCHAVLHDLVAIAPASQVTVRITKTAPMPGMGAVVVEMTHEHG